MEYHSSAVSARKSANVGGLTPTASREIARIPNVVCSWESLSRHIQITYKTHVLATKLSLIASAIVVVASLGLSARAFAENVTCDPAVDTSIYYCRGWQDGVGKYGSRVRFIARMMWDDGNDKYGTSNFGPKVVSLGDINGDGRGDFTVWVQGDCAWRIYLGDTLIPRTPWMIWPSGEPPYPCSPFPGNLAVIPDVTGDGFSDVFRSIGGLPPNREIWIYSLGPLFDTIPELILADSALHFPIGLNGESLVGGFDVNGDSQPDFAFGDESWFQESPKRWGRVYVYWGGTALDSIPDLILTDTCWVGQNQYQPVATVAMLPSLNADAYADLVIGRASINYLPNPVGRADVFFGGPAMDTARDLVLFSPDTARDPDCDYYPSIHFGFGIRNVGDVDQDGYDDLLVSGQGCTPAYIFSGGPDFDTTLDLRLSQPWPTLHGEGRLVRALGDVDGDGFSDFCTVREGHELYRGSINIHFSRPNPTGVVDWTILGDHWLWAFRNFGRSATDVGDVDGDGYDDIAVAALTQPYNEFNDDVIFIFAGYNPDINSGVFDDPETSVPSDHQLIESIAPNPFNSGTTLRLSESFDSGTLMIYNILGQTVRTFAVGETTQRREVEWDGRDESGRSLSSGLYFARATSGGHSETHKLVLLK